MDNTISGGHGGRYTDTEVSLLRKARIILLEKSLELNEFNVTNILHAMNINARTYQGVFGNRKLSSLVSKMKSL